MSFIRKKQPGKREQMAHIVYLSFVKTITVVCRAQGKELKSEGKYLG